MSIDIQELTYYKWHDKEKRKGLEMAKSFKTSQNALSSYEDPGNPDPVDVGRKEFALHLRTMMDMETGDPYCP